MANDLRAWLSKVEANGELKHVHGADWNGEIGTISSLHSRAQRCCALLFDDIKGYKKGFRVLTCSVTELSRMQIMLGFPESRSNMEVVKHMCGKLAEWEARMPEFPPQVVQK